MDIQKLKYNLERVIGTDKIKYDEPMFKHTSFKVGGNADIYIEANSIDMIKNILDINCDFLPIIIIGNGSNILVSDSGIRGIVIKYVDDNYEINDTEVKVSSGMLNAKLAQILLKNNLSGFEAMSGIPGTVGGAIYMNAGAYGTEIADILKDVTYLDFRSKKMYTIQNKECNFKYRSSIFEENDYLILNATLILHKDLEENIKKRMDEYREKRKNSQPQENPNAGSTFKRGNEYITAELIDKAGLKGYKIGGAEVSKKHAGFIVNTGNATAKDIIDLISYVQDKVYEKFKVKIETEVRIIK